MKHLILYFLICFDFIRVSFCLFPRASGCFRHLYGEFTSAALNFFYLFFFLLFFKIQTFLLCLWKSLFPKGYHVQNCNVVTEHRACILYFAVGCEIIFLYSYAFSFSLIHLFTTHSLLYKHIFELNNHWFCLLIPNDWYVVPETFFLFF